MSSNDVTAGSATAFPKLPSRMYSRSLLSR